MFSRIFISTTTRAFHHHKDKYLPDPFYAPLRQGEERPFSWGLNLLVWSAAMSSPEAVAPLKEVYQEWRKAAAKELIGTGALIFPWAALHVTATTPSPYSAEPARMAAGWTEADRQLTKAAWAAALRRTKNEVDLWPHEPFALTFTAPRFSQGVAIIDVIDSTGAVSALRAAVAVGTSAEPALRALPRHLRESAGSKVPNIVHSTVIRLFEKRDTNVSDEELEARFARASALWPGPITIMADAAHLVEGNELFVMSVRPQDAIVLSLRYE